MEPEANRDVVTIRTTPDRTVDPEQLLQQPADAPAAAPVVAPVAPPATVERFQSVSMFAPHAVAAGLLAVAMLVWGGVTLARADIDDTWRAPVVDVAGIGATALAGAIVLAIGVLLLIGAVGRHRPTILFVSLLAGIAGLIVAIEPDVGDAALGGDASLGTWVAIGCAVVVVVALVAPTMTRRTSVVDRV